MSKRSGLGIFGGLLVFGAALGVLKYLKDYGGADYLNKEKLDSVKADSSKVKEAAKRTYTTIKEKADVDSVKEAVGDLAKAASQTAVSAGDVAFAAGSSAVSAAKDVKAKFDTDPETSKKEMINNLKDMGQDIVSKASDYGQEIKDKAMETVDKVKDAMSTMGQEKDDEDKEEDKKEDSPDCESYTDVINKEKEDFTDTGQDLDKEEINKDLSIEITDEE